MNRIAIVGDWSLDCYEPAFARGLAENGVDVISFRCSDFFSGVFGRIQRAFPTTAFATLRLNRELVKFCEAETPDAVLFWRPTHLLPDTVRCLNSQGILTASYNNDDPFHQFISHSLPRAQYRIWRLYLRCLSHFNFNFFYRRINVEEARAHGASNCHLLLPYFNPEYDRPIVLDPSEEARFNADVVFAGHFEEDGRDKLLGAVIASGYDTRIWGGKYWSNELLRSMGYKQGPVTPVIGRDYSAALCGAKVCLAFLSKLNRDTYTRRCFEIPACGRLLLAERTDDLLGIFDEDKEACFFSSRKELLEKLDWLIRDDSTRAEIARAGLRRVWRDGHDVKSRAEGFLNAIKGSDIKVGGI
jgi:spore maturation protein CgeB